jgi:hypothetical protein
MMPGQIPSQPFYPPYSQGDCGCGCGGSKQPGAGINGYPMAGGHQGSYPYGMMPSYPSYNMYPSQEMGSYPQMERFEESADDESV